MTIQPQEPLPPMDVRNWGLEINDHGHLVSGGCDVVDLADRIGTPLHVVDETRLRANTRQLVAAFARRYPDVRVSYSYKTNCVPGALKVLHDEGCGAEVISEYELWLAERLGVEPQHIVYNGVGRSARQLAHALRRGVGALNIDSSTELLRLVETGVDLGTTEIGLRIDPGVGWRAHFGLETPLQIAEAVADRVRISAVHAHMGTGMRSAVSHVRAVSAACASAARLRAATGTEIRTINLGGGFGVPTVKTLRLREAALYKILGRPPVPPRPDRCPTVDEFAESITSALRDGCARHGLGTPTLHLEPGRALTSDAQMLLVRVTDVKTRRDGRSYAITDGGMQSIAFPLSYEYHHVLVAGQPDAAPTERYSVTGPLCSPEDLLYRNWPLPAVAPGDVLAILDAGAYFTSFANNFSHPRPAVALTGSGGHTVVRMREGFDHMAAPDLLPQPTAPGEIR